MAILLFVQTDESLPDKEESFHLYFRASSREHWRLLLTVASVTGPRGPQTLHEFLSSELKYFW